jgi:hypothetical protein
MSERQIFGVAVRVIGLIILLYALSLVLYLALHFLGITVALRQSTAVDVAFAVMYLVVGLALLKGADTVTRLAYGPA